MEPVTIQQPFFQPQTQPQLASQDSSTRIFASPLAKTLASSKNLDLSNLAGDGKGTGPGGRIIAQDVLKMASMPSKSVIKSALSFSTGDSYIDISLTNMRKTIAKRLLESKTTIPHYYLTVDIIADDMLKCA